MCKNGLFYYKNKSGIKKFIRGFVSRKLNFKIVAILNKIHAYSSPSTVDEAHAKPH